MDQARAVDSRSGLLTQNGSHRVVTYSRAYTVVPTYECFNRCTYCNFRVDPGQSPWLSLEHVAQRLPILRRQGVCEVLVLSGEVAPNSPRRDDWFRHIYQICALALEAGLLPHTNAGPLSRDEMAQLRQVNVSMGLMVEQVTPKLLDTVHRHAPSKRPEVRLQQLTWAGELRIPFTTGLLLGLGESEADWVDSLRAIAALQTRYGHIQEVILQPHSPGQQQLQPGMALDEAALVRAVHLAREYLPPEVAIQIPPNLVSHNGLLDCLTAGARDLGGISPVDEVNPDYDHPTPESLGDTIAPSGWQLQPRLPIYPQYDTWLPDPLRSLVKTWRTSLSNP
ncbi:MULTISPECIES: 7,8-didemethyl-8-hydroxy-5-deazariboflavin synthase subunit CofG [Cyanophyceae]|uniref:7,8-didemethyl-8-hydroxy-5-deazariboflavin synthase subunit CofG n=1 Tax=Cyanophyceae TaxID=3028117 RepID=UPI00168732DA|nr:MULTISPECIES: 7,8-didemethyl-8-hydroxy-5-deazariboflavin synthase subunit CofG [Cyanophyceae]MBD1917721.1 7,8-didemethyl-8-hydroxy-5-deazariboflavin synthase subunit CofG [Phormidium sp. FACHB-77]MBD2032840.1 7,8-didemethyl-8-hydroxy-5-deazariboflavin synthase subunit CofG [Phormidium sp. FACHB-322]MBD2051587.1 7,8-didemethyl-8-hydroxy-5-deazariboflavin synthase subunit CofG [Leptolyngbya sp. FACHB-60]